MRDHLSSLQAAVNFLDLMAGKVLRMSSVCETSPVYLIDHDAFYNVVIEIDTSLEPLALLEVFKKFEQELGRIPRNKGLPPRNRYRYAEGLIKGGRANPGGVNSGNTFQLPTTPKNRWKPEGS